MVSKKISRLVARFKREVAERNVEGVLNELKNNPSAELLICLREQKLLYCASETSLREQIAQAMDAAARVSFAESDQNLYRNYIKFALLTIQVYGRLTARAEILLRQFPKLSLQEVLQIAADTLERGVRPLIDARLPPTEEGTELPESVAAAERALHDRNGLANDMYFAVARALNEISRNITKKTYGAGSAVRTAAATMFDAIVSVASEWNALEFVVDNVAFGEFQVTAFEDSPKPVVSLDYVDPRRVLLRQLSLRRALVGLLSGSRRKRWVREILSPQVQPILDEAVTYFERLTRQAKIPNVELIRCETQARKVLLPIDAEDDLLCAASKSPDRILLYYTLAAALQWFTHAAALVRKHLPQRFARVLAVPAVTPEVIVGLFDTTEDRRAVIREVLEELSVELPVRRHFDLAKLPFIRDGSGHIRIFNGVGLWNVAIRELLIQGGMLGKDLGRIWEDFIKQTFVTSGWVCIGQGVRIRANGRIATDVDLLLMRDGLLLIAQVKAVTGSGIGPYDHWKTQQTIEFGCYQARLVAEILVADPQRLVSVSNTDTAAQIKHIEPVVLTNADALDGWVCNGVTVLATGSINSITQGMRVEYKQESGRVIESKDVVESADLSRDKILWMLRHPVETLVAAEDGRSDYIVQQIESVEWRVPFLSVRAGPLDLSGPGGDVRGLST